MKKYKKKNQEVLKAIESSSRSYDEIVRFLDGDQ